MIYSASNKPSFSFVEQCKYIVTEDFSITGRVVHYKIKRMIQYKVKRNALYYSQNTIHKAHRII